MSEQRISQGMRELVTARAGCRQCEARIEKLEAALDGLIKTISKGRIIEGKDSYYLARVTIHEIIKARKALGGE